MLAINVCSFQFPGGRPSKFLYSGKNKKIDPWGTSDTDHENGIEHSLQPKNKLLKTKDTRSSPGDKLKWLCYEFRVFLYCFVCKLNP